MLININSLSVTAEKKNMVFLFAFMQLVFTSVSTAQECSCPVVQCDPCQRRIVMDAQKIMCTADKSVVCENVVCENVDNYFQCVQGASAQYIPPENPQERMTDPRIPEVSNPQQPIAFPDLDLQDFKHFNHIDSTISPEEKPVVHRGLASKNKKVTPSAHAPEEIEDYPWLKEKKEAKVPFVFQGLYNAAFDGKKIKPLKKHILNDTSTLLTAYQKQVFSFEFGKTHAQMVLAKDSQLKISQEDNHVIIHPIKGQMWVRKISAENMMVFDGGEWRIGKMDGDMRWSFKNADTVFYNAKGAALLRRDQLIAKSESIEAGVELIVSMEYGIVHADHDIAPKDKEFRLRDRATSTRVLASSPIANQGCEQPKGETQQCAWKCFGGKGKGCENSQTTQCVRFTCSMGGEWKLPTRVPGKECRGQSVVVNSCQ
jgi:hypothetical protein